jgi:hypothetical protein
MKVLIFHIGTPTPVFETELELIRKHERLGDRVRVLQCSGNLANCFWNRDHIESLCTLCRSRFKNGWNLLNSGSGVDLKEIPPQDPAIPELPASFDSVSDIIRYQHDSANIGYGAASSLVSFFRDHRFDTRKHRDDIVRELRTATQMHEILKREFQDFQPDLVYFFNGRIASQLPAKLLCERMGIAYASYEVASTRNSYRLLRGSTVHQAIPIEEIQRLHRDWSAERRRIGESFFLLKRERTQFEHVPVYAGRQAGGVLPRGFDRSNRNIAIFNSTIDEYAATEDWRNKIYEPDETAGIRKILESFESDDRFMFYLRVHPNLKDVSSRTSQLLDIRELGSRFANLCVIWPEEVVDSYALMDSCEKVLTFGSTMGVEATYWGKPSILAGQAYYENFGCVHAPRTHEELVNLLKMDLDPSSAESALKYGYWELSNGIPFEHFVETGFENGLATGTFDGVEIGPSPLVAVWCHIQIFSWRALKALTHPPVLREFLRRRLRALKLSLRTRVPRKPGTP